MTFQINATAFDDHPISGTSEDLLNVSVQVRDDDDHVFIPNGKGIGGRKESTIVESQGSPTIYYNNGRKVVVDKDYNIYVIYTKQNPDPTISWTQVWCAKSDDNGDSWEKHLVSSPKYFQ